MVSKKSELSLRRRGPNHIKADVIVLGCSIPGLVAAHKLKKRFGDSMNIVVLDLVSTTKTLSKSNVAFQEEEEDSGEYIYEGTAKDLIDNVARHYLNIFAKEFNIPLPEAIITPEKIETSFSKLFEYNNGITVKCTKDFHDFDYLNVMERFELNQFQNLIDQSMKDLFQAHHIDDTDGRKLLLYYDQTTMESYICDSLFFTTSREITRNIVKLVCGVPADRISVLFYLHQCYRSSGMRNHVDGSNTRIREKLFRYCRKYFTSKLQQSISNIKLNVKAIKEISFYSDEEVILKSLKDDTVYVCNLLAMALKPDQLINIEVEKKLISEKEREMLSYMKKGKVKKFVIEYEEHFWRAQGYSGDILSLKGPIIWATERPKFSSFSSEENYATLIGYLRTKEEEEDSNSKNQVIRQLVNLFGKEASEPICYKEQSITDIYVPRCGDFETLNTLLRDTKLRGGGYLDWAALDIFGEGDMAAALEAGHFAYLHLLSFIRPQAQTFEDIRTAEWPTILNGDSPLLRWLMNFNIVTTGKLLVLTSLTYFGMRLIQNR